MSTPPDRRLAIAMIGTRGVPARYGGFETCVEEVGQRLAAKGHVVRVYSRTQNPYSPSDMYLGMELIHLPALRRRSLETLSHSLLSTLHLMRRRTDVAIMFNSANAVLLPLVRGAHIPVATHVDGLEWKRSKWGRIGRKYYRVAERLAVRLSDTLIADSEGIGRYYREEFDAPTEFISYGAPIIHPGTDRLGELSLEPQRYHLVVARFEPENHIHVIIEGYCASSAEYPLVVVGSAPYSDRYAAFLRARADDRVVFVGAIWDQSLLNQLYANCLTYFHGHSVGGTNPSLLRAMGAGAPCCAYDVNFNQEVLRSCGTYWNSCMDVTTVVERAEGDPSSQIELGRRCRIRAREFDWDAVAENYESMCLRLATFGPTRGAHRPSGRRRSSGRF